MICKNLIAICSKTHLPCPHVATDGECREAECANAVVPTWQELLDIYAASVKPTVRRLKSIQGNFRTLTKVLGTTLDAKVAVTDEQIDAAYARLLTDHQPETVQAIFDSVKATTGRRRELKIEYRKRGKQSPDIDFPVVEKKMKPVVQLTDAQRLAVRERITMLRGGKSETDRNRFKWLWFAWNFGMRPVDIGHITWSCIVTHSNGSTWLDYVPTKTAKTGKHAGCKLTDDQVEEIRPFIGQPDELVIPLDVTKRGKIGRGHGTHGEYVAHHASLRKYVIEFMKSIGVTDRKPQYALRKDRSQETIKKHGILHEAQMLGHTPNVAMRNYADISKIELRDGL